MCPGPAGAGCPRSPCRTEIQGDPARREGGVCPLRQPPGQPDASPWGSRLTRTLSRAGGERGHGAEARGAVDGAGPAAAERRLAPSVPADAPVPPRPPPAPAPPPLSPGHNFPCLSPPTPRISLLLLKCCVGSLPGGPGVRSGAGCGEQGDTPAQGWGKGGPLQAGSQQQILHPTPVSPVLTRTFPAPPRAPELAVLLGRPQRCPALLSLGEETGQPPSSPSLDQSHGAPSSAHRLGNWGCCRLRGMARMGGTSPPGVCARDRLGESAGGSPQAGSRARWDRREPREDPCK
ncbi:zinc-binding protein A33-like [Platysternon megacephalum]|uniref:Zinc-binding protein A33-like n=1 Tax=Platysternon megacephalum TaxID=55544 RepID=A0A4D9DUK6_9SAUR|nr:zinc-binding protein A33-like [Platysternon megacephalum]